MDQTSVMVGCAQTQPTNPEASATPRSAAALTGIDDGIYFVISDDSVTFHSCPINDNKLSMHTKFREGPCGGGFFVRGGKEASLAVELADGKTAYFLRFHEGLIFGSHPTPSVLVGYADGSRFFRLLSGTQAKFRLLPGKIVVLGDPLDQNNDPQQIADQLLESYPSLASRLDVGEPVKVRCPKREGTRKNFFGRVVGSGAVTCTVEPAGV